MDIIGKVIVKPLNLSFIAKDVHIMSENEVHRCHWGKLYRFKTKYKRSVTEAYDSLSPIEKTIWDILSKRKTKRRVKLISVRPYFIKDPDNLVGGFKPFVDTLRYTRLLVDDDKTWAQIEYSQEKSPPLTPLTNKNRAKGSKRRKRAEFVKVYIEEVI